MTSREIAHAIRTYQATRYDRFGEDDPRFVHPMDHVRKSRTRLYAALRSGLAHLPGTRGLIMDFGPYPGSLLRLLRRLYADPAMRLAGAGLMTDAAFIQFMKEDAGAEVFTVNLDPVNTAFRHKAYPDRVPFADGTVDLAFALEIIEHLNSPFHLIAEACRVLKPGGHLIVTTPNVTRIGNIFKLLIGRSPNDRLAPPGYENPDDEWRPHVREYAMAELVEILEAAGFTCVERRFFLGEDTHECVRDTRQRAVDLAKVPFYAVPHLRGSLLIAARKRG